MKIGLIAMNGILVQNQELARLGVTLPGVLERGRVLASMPSLALLTIAAVIPKEHTVEYIEVPDLSKLTELPGGFDCVGISSYSAQIKEAYELADRYRQQGVPVILGGPHVTCLPLEAARHCDAVAIGEGEPIWPRIIADLESGELQPFYGAQFSQYDLSDAPMPRFDLLDPSKYNRITIQSSRGCPHRCEFCAASILIAKRYKQKPADKVLREIDAVKEIWNRPFIEFADDNSLIDRAYWKELLQGLKKRRVRWFCETDISVANDPELLDLMHDSGCAQVLIGLESPSRDAMHGLEMVSDWKSRTWPTYARAVKAIQKRGIRVIGCFILGLDRHDKAVFDDLYDFVERLQVTDIQITVQTPFPGTPLYERLKETDRLIEPNDWSRCTLFDVNFQPSNMSVTELEDGFRQLGLRLYTEEGQRRRRIAFKNIRKQKQSRKTALSAS